MDGLWVFLEPKNFYLDVDPLIEREGEDDCQERQDIDPCDEPESIFGVLVLVFVFPFQESLLVLVCVHGVFLSKGFNLYHKYTTRESRILVDRNIDSIFKSSFVFVYK